MTNVSSLLFASRYSSKASYLKLSGGLRATLFSALVFLSLFSSAFGQERVGVAIAIGLDRSGSITGEEMSLAVNGIAAALQDEDVVDRIALRGGAAISVFTWESGQATPILGWHLIRSREEAESYGQALVTNTPSVSSVVGRGSGLTDHGQALLMGYDLHTNNPYFAERMLLNIVTDGQINHDANLLAERRQRVVDRGITVNALIVSRGSAGLLSWAERELIGGFASFALDTPSFEDFQRAFVRKLLLEIS